MDGLNSYRISKLGAEAGFKVALSGQGGDELFGGYDSLARFQRFNTVARWARPLPANPFGRLLDQNAFPFRWRKLSYLIGADDPFVAAQLAVQVLFLDLGCGRADFPFVLSPAAITAKLQGTFDVLVKAGGKRGSPRASRLHGHTHASGAAAVARPRRHEHGSQHRSAAGFSRSSRGRVPTSHSVKHSHAAEAAAAGGRKNFSASRVAGGFSRAPEAHIYVSVSALAVARSAPRLERSICAGPPSRHRHS